MLSGCWPNHPVEVTAHSVGFLGCSRAFLWAAAHRERCLREQTQNGGATRKEQHDARPVWAMHKAFFPPPPLPVWRFYERKHPHSLWYGDFMEKVTPTALDRTAYQLTLLDDYSRRLGPEGSQAVSLSPRACRRPTISQARVLRCRRSNQFRCWLKT
jgi:hypothetical protein